MATIVENGPARASAGVTSIGPGSVARADDALLQEGRRLFESLSELVRVLQFRDRDRACCYGVSVSQCYALKAVVDAGGVTVNELSASLYLDKSTASRIANGLVERGLAERERDLEDGRVVRLVATAEGHDLCGRIEGDLAVEYAELLRDFDPEVRSAMPHVLAGLARSFRARVDTSGGSCCSV
jgi:MarR family 2-MHQ and catechol resistance regulon transcriptional repressor